MNLMEIKNSLEPENIKRILSEYGVVPSKEETDYFIYPTICHNLEGGSDKLYYYFDSKLFVCYTHCGESFNIFELIQKMEALRGYKINIFDAAERIGFGTHLQRRKTEEEIIAAKTLNFINNSLSRQLAPTIEYEEINNDILKNLDSDPSYLSPWLSEGMTIEELRRFEIGYSIKDLAIAIPHRDKDGKLIGLRGRFMAPDAPNKYMPLSINGRLLGHALRGNLYGIYQNLENIKRIKRVVLYEGEKSVVTHGSHYGSNNNIALATCGNKVTNEQINLLSEIGVEEVVLAFDNDQTSPYERDSLMSKYIEIGERMAPYFRVSIIIDWEDNLNFKDSPIDQGPKVFDKLFKDRFYV